MANKEVYTTEEITAIYERHWKTVWRVCYSFMKNIPDTEDMVQETFMKLINSRRKLSDADHEKAWLIVTASNACKDCLKHWSRYAEDIDEHDELCAQDDTDNLPYERLTKAILALPAKYKTEVYLYFYEGYTTAEIAKLLHIPHATVRTGLRRAKAILKKELGDEYYG